MSPDEINMHLQECDWSVPPPPVSDLDIEQGLSMLLTNNVQGVIDLLAPEKTVHLIKKNSPWLNTEHELLLAKSDATLRRYVRSGQRHLLKEFFDFSNIAEEKLEMWFYV